MIAKLLQRSCDFVEPTPALNFGRGIPSADGLDEDAAWRVICRMRWPETYGSPRCPKCGSESCYTLTTRRKFKCKLCEHQFSAVSGTAFDRFKGGYVGLLTRLAYDGPVHKAGFMQEKTACDMRRRKLANGER